MDLLYAVGKVFAQDMAANDVILDHASDAA